MALLEHKVGNAHPTKLAVNAEAAGKNYSGVMILQSGRVFCAHAGVALPDVIEGYCLQRSLCRPTVEKTKNIVFLCALCGLRVYSQNLKDCNQTSYLIAYKAPSTLLKNTLPSLTVGDENNLFSVLYFQRKVPLEALIAYRK